MGNANKKTIAWLQISAGQGPKECGWVVVKLAQEILRDAMAAKLLAERVEALAFDKHLRKQTLIDADAYLSIVIRLEGFGAEIFAKAWEGTIKWQGESPYRPKHKRINWFVGVTLLPLSAKEKIAIEALSKEVEFEAIRSKGPGGQHVNKTNSAIRLTHRQTGIQLRVDSDRSQHRNKQLALERLFTLLQQQKDQQQALIDKERWLTHYQVNRGNPVKTFYGFDFIQQ